MSWKKKLLILIYVCIIIGIILFFKFRTETRILGLHLQDKAAELTPFVKTSFVDSDNDTVPDQYDAHPLGGSREITRKINGEIYFINEDWYEYYRTKPRPKEGSAYVTQQDPLIASILSHNYDTFDEIVEGRTFRASRILNVIDYLHEITYVQDASLNFDDYPKYPMETLIEETGDCEDTAYLAASLLEGMNLDTVLLRFSNHMAVGVDCELEFDEGGPLRSCKGTYYEWKGKKYFYVETTGKGWDIGQVPKDYQSEIPKIYDVPHIREPWNYVEDSHVYL